MENPRSPLLSWPYYYQGKSMEDSRQSLLFATLELESTRIVAHEEITKREEEITKLQEILNKTITERNQAQQKCNSLLLQNLLPTQTQKPWDSSIEYKTFLKKGGLTFSSSDCEESIVSLPPQHLHSPESAFQLILTRKPLPEKGKLLQAVMNSGPLLQTLLLAGPLPQWRHPPPPLERIEIPPVQIPACFDEVWGNTCGVIANRKICFVNGGSDSCETSKYQRVLFP